MKRKFGAVNNGDADKPERQGHHRRTRYSRRKAGLNNDDPKQEEDAVIEPKVTELAKGSKKEHKPGSNEVLPANRTTSQDQKIQESKGSVKEEEDNKNSFELRYCVCPSGRPVEEQINSKDPYAAMDFFRHLCRDKAGNFVYHGIVEVSKEEGRLKVLRILR
ncbi:hypothetical protein OIDMADRAFT_149817 [Oidiodendron maius Zn]|uniref:Uncharacterized protein n=1 Tax=Oidiodendron maius (strain Zn) TaxID=913774 RepID=A0A0C3GRN3_OIDMZ|nr:hypothetical protein OIDMADRAFT_149817 [Oidiodendron maius Zn]